MKKYDKNSFYEDFKSVLDLTINYKFINNAYSVKEQTLRIFKEELIENSILYFQLLDFKTKKPLSDLIYYINTDNFHIESSEDFITINIADVRVSSLKPVEIPDGFVKTIIKPDYYKPDYYKSKSGQDVIDVIADFDMDFLTGNVFKYIVRAGKKEDMIKDLNKAKEYIDRKIKFLKNE